MRRLASLGLACMLVVAGVGLTAAPSDAKHKYRSYNHGGISFGLSFGSPYYYSHYPPHRVYRYRVVPGARYSSAWDAHVAWCYSRYRSYRDWDNTFQPYNGPRRECRSPYYG
jgi:hypothetical protein